MKTRSILDFNFAIRIPIGSEVTILNKASKAKMQAIYKGAENHPANHCEVFSIGEGDAPIKNEDVDVIYKNRVVGTFIVGNYRTKTGEMVLIKHENLPHID